MKGLVLVLSTMAVVLLGVWVYNETDRTQTAMRDLRQLHDQFAATHTELRMQRAEWAYLNRPDRLADLAAANFDRLGLLPLRPESFGTIAQVLTRPEPIAPLDGQLIDPVDVEFIADPGVEPL